jgi:glutathione S-transferase
MKLTDSSASPFVRKTKVVLHETGLTDSVALVPVQTTPLKTAPEVAVANPLGKIPALMRDDAPALYDSRVICRYLDHHAQAGLYPEARLWDVLTLEATGDGIMDAAVSATYETRLRGPEAVSQDWIDAQYSKINNAIDALEARWMSHLHGPLDMGQISVACALGYVDFRHAGLDWRTGRASLAAWYSTFSERPSMLATVPEG